MTEFEITLQLLVDGELSSAERNRFIRSLEQNPARYRRVALAYVEQQVTDEVCRDLVAHNPVENRNVCSDNSLRSNVTAHSKSGRPEIHKTIWFVALAASLLLGVFIGHANNISRRQSISKKDVPQQRIEAREAGSRNRLADAIAKSPMPIPFEFRNRLLKAGYLISENETFTEVELPVGGTVSIPTRQVEIQYLGLSVYQ